MSTPSYREVSAQAQGRTELTYLYITKKMWNQIKLIFPSSAYFRSSAGGAQRAVKPPQVSEEKAETTGGTDLTEAEGAGERRNY